jgi:hypothetical protein
MKCVNASCVKFLVLEVETGVTCMAMQVLGMAELSDIPTMNIPPKDDAPDIIKKIYLGRVSVQHNLRELCK